MREKLIWAASCRDLICTLFILEKCSSKIYFWNFFRKKFFYFFFEILFSKLVFAKKCFQFFRKNKKKSILSYFPYSFFEKVFFLFLVEKLRKFSIKGLMSKISHLMRKFWICGVQVKNPPFRSKNPESGMFR